MAKEPGSPSPVSVNERAGGPSRTDAVKDAVSDAASAAAETPPTVDAVGKNAAVLSGPNSGEESTQTFQGTGNGSQPVSIPSVPGVGIPRSLRQWERFEVLEVLGAGGMGAVYKVRDPRLSRLVALKIVHPMLGHPDSSRAEIFIRRFVREARMQASLDHPHICKIPGGCQNSDGRA